MNSHTTPRKVIITGSNKGIGYEIAALLLASTTPYEVILTARNPTLGQNALEALRSRYPEAVSKLIYHQLDVNDDTSINAFADWAKNTLGHIDVLVNNAGVARQEENDEGKKFTIQTNFSSVVKVTEKLLPLLSEDGKIIMISSFLGELSGQGETLRKALDDPYLDRTKLLQLADNFLEVSKDYQGNEFTKDPSYPGSKALLNAYVRYVLFKQLEGNQQVHTICPGWCKTDMGSDAAPLTAADGADTPVYLIELPFKRDPELHGKFITERKVRGW